MSDKRTSAKYDYLIKLLLIGDSRVGKSCLLLRHSDDSFTSAFEVTIGIDFKIKSVMCGESKVKLQIWDTGGQERFRTITTAYFRGAMGMLIVYDVTDQESFNNVRYWMRLADTNAAADVTRILVGNKCDVNPSDRKITYAQGSALAAEYGIKFFETSAKLNTNVDEAFMTIATDVVQHLKENPPAPDTGGVFANSDSPPPSASSATASDDDPVLPPNAESNDPPPPSAGRDLSSACVKLLEEVAQAPARRDAMQRRDALQAEFDAADAADVDFELIASLGVQLQELEKESAQLPLSEEDYLTLADRHAGLVQRVTDACRELKVAKDFVAMGALAKQLTALKAADVSALQRTSSDDPVLPAVGALILSEDDGAMDPVLPP